MPLSQRTRTRPPRNRAVIPPHSGLSPRVTAESPARGGNPPACARRSGRAAMRDRMPTVGAEMVPADRRYTPPARRPSRLPRARSTAAAVYVCPLVPSAQPRPPALPRAPHAPSHTARRPASASGLFPTHHPHAPSACTVRVRRPCVSVEGHRQEFDGALAADVLAGDACTEGGTRPGGVCADLIERTEPLLMAIELIGINRFWRCECGSNVGSYRTRRFR
ncbi:hypothetical protein BJY22_004776 [Kribbella shirazensis]|uniref:Uncharacterized protein n=1 Tax=Kribbella shirazensis TaxID=1105143 RepID=A0A7X6A383_9ACTN|nr:hypothetical protein [Kribbella shirazensis]